MAVSKQDLQLDNLNSILIVNLVGLGDNIMSLPLVKKIRELSKNAKIDVLVPYNRKAVFYNFDVNVYEIDPHDIKSLQKLNLGKYDLLVDCNFSSTEGNPNYRDILDNLRYGLCIGFDNKDMYSFMENHMRIKKLKDNRFLNFFENFTHKLNMYAQFMALISIFGIKVKYTEIFCSIEVNPNNSALAKKYLPKNNKLNVCICPGSPERSKRWQHEKYAQVAKYLHLKYKANVIILGADYDEDAGISIMQSLGDFAMDLTGKLTLAEFLGVLSNVDLVLCNEGGAMHASGALGKKTIVISPKDKIAKFSPPNNTNITFISAKDIKEVDLYDVIRVCDKECASWKK